MAVLMGNRRGKIDLLAELMELPQREGKSDTEIIRFYVQWGVDLSGEMVEESEEGQDQGVT